MELDENLLRDDSELVYKDKSIYVLQYKEENQASVSYGLILDIVGNEITINNDIGEGSLGAPILNLSTNKVIGICQGITAKGSLIRKDFNFNYKMPESYPKNEIKVTFNIQQEDIGKKIYYMYNISKNKDENNYLDNKEDNHIARAKSLEIYHYFLNDYHPKIYINEIENKEFDYYFKPTEAKLYTVIIKFTKEIPDCSYMFYDCDRIISIDLSFFDSKKVNNMRHMFNGCSNLRYINFSNIDTRNVINMERIFCNCFKLKYLDLSNFNTKNVIYMDFMFYNAKNLEKIIFSENFKTINVINMDYMFSGCLNLKELNLSTFETDNVTNMSNMFYKCGNLKEINLLNFNTENVTSMDLMFYSCKKLKKLDLSSFNTSKVTNMAWMFYDCSKLEELNLASFNTENVRDMEDMFSNCKKIKVIDITNFNTENVLYMDFMFDICSSLEEIKISSLFTTKEVTNMKGMFYDCGKLHKVNFEQFDTSNVTNMKWMFYEKKLMIWKECFIYVLN